MTTAERLRQMAQNTRFPEGYDLPWLMEASKELEECQAQLKNALESEQRYIDDLVELKESSSTEISELKAKVAALTEALEAIYADGKLSGGSGEGYGLVIYHQSIARRALGLN